MPVSQECLVPPPVMANTWMQVVARRNKPARREQGIADVLPDRLRYLSKRGIERVREERHYRCSPQGRPAGLAPGDGFSRSPGLLAGYPAPWPIQLTPSARRSATRPAGAATPPGPAPLPAEDNSGTDSPRPHNTRDGPAGTRGSATPLPRLCGEALFHAPNQAGPGSPRPTWRLATPSIEEGPLPTARSITNRLSKGVPRSITSIEEGHQRTPSPSMLMPTHSTRV